MRHARPFWCVCWLGGFSSPREFRSFYFRKRSGWDDSQRSVFLRPIFFGPFVGVVEIVCGGMLIIGFLTRLAAIPLLIDITVAILTTKVPMLMKSGFWATMHEARTDFCMWLGALFLLIVGAGPWSVDRKLEQKQTSP